MKYVPPYGRESEGDAAHYINGNPAEAREGSIPPAAVFENPQRELIALIEKSKFTPIDTDLLQVAKGVRSQRMNYADDTGSVNALSVAYDPPITSYTVGLPVRVKVKNTNNGPSTIDAGGGRVQIRKPNGAQVGAGDLPAGALAELVYDGSAFQMINFGGAGGGLGDVFYYNIPYTVDSSPTPNLITANFSPAVTSLTAGTILMVKVANTNTGPTTINVQGLGPKQVYALGGADLLPSDVVAGDIVIFSYDGTRFYITPYPAYTQNVTLNVPSSQYANMANVFAMIARKRIPPAVTVTIQMGNGIFPQMTTYHIDADRIVVQGTMLAAAPTANDFAKTGSSAAARAADSASNIAMLRTRFGTELKWTNAQFFGISHLGPGRITFKNLLITGDNVFAGANYIKTRAIESPRGGSILCDTVCIWGSGSMGFTCVEGVIDCFNCYACSCMADGFFAFVSGTMVLDHCGSFGNSFSGFEASQNSSLYFNDVVYANMNAMYGVTVSVVSTCQMSNSQALGNGSGDVRADDLSAIEGQSAAWTNASPATNTMGNNGSLVRAI